MYQTILNWCMILHVYNDYTDAIDLTAVANEFVSRNFSRLVLVILCRFVFISILNFGTPRIHNHNAFFGHPLNIEVFYGPVRKGESSFLACIKEREGVGILRKD